MIELFRYKISPEASLVGSLDPHLIGREEGSSNRRATKWTLEHQTKKSDGSSITLTSDIDHAEAELIMKGLEHNQRERHHQDDVRSREFQHENYARDQQRVQWRP